MAGVGRESVQRQYRRQAHSSGIVLFFFYWVVFGNANKAEREFERLCETDAKATIYKSVFLSPEHFDEKGRPIERLPKKPEIFIEIADHYASIYKKTVVSKRPRLEKETLIYKDLNTDETLGVITSFHYTPSYLFPVPGEVQGQYCKDKGLVSSDYHNNFRLAIFKKQP